MVRVEIVSRGLEVAVSDGLSRHGACTLVATASAAIWAPVVAAVGTGALTWLGAFFNLQWQQRRAERASAATIKASAYRDLLASSLSFSIRARTLRDTMQQRSG